jgi:hypothetical protein
VVAGFVLVAGGLALRAPLDVVVLGFLVLGLPHVVFEIRHVVGRYAPVLRGRFFVLLNVVLVAIVLERLVVPAGIGRPAELASALVLLALGVTRVKGRRRRLVAGAAVATVGIVAATFVDQWFLVVAHVHNVVPLVFLWEWTAARPEPFRRAVRSGSVVLFVVVPVALALGVADAWLGLGRGLPGGPGANAGVVGSVVPSGASELWTVRLLAAFAFAQLAHYAVWCWFLPRHAPAEARASSGGTSVGRTLSSRRLVLAAVTGSLLVTLVALVDYRQGRTLYTSLAAYHAYLELPLLVVLLAARPSAGLEPAARPLDVANQRETIDHVVAR